MVHLVEAPEQRDPVERPVPEVADELVREQSDHGATCDAETGEVHQSMGAEPLVPEQGRVGREHDVQDEEGEALHAPEGDARVAARRQGDIEQDEEDVGTDEGVVHDRFEHQVLREPRRSGGSFRGAESRLTPQA